MRRQSLVAALVLATAAPLAAQTPASPAVPRKIDPLELRHQIYVMEGALARAVAFGAQRLNNEIRSVMPDLLVLAGDANARGFHLDGHGVFFDVEVPVLRQSMMWSLRMMLEQDQQGARTALSQLKRHIDSLPASERGGLDTALRQLELRITAFSPDVPPGVPANAPNPFAAAAAAAGNGASAQPVSSGAAVSVPQAPAPPVTAAPAPPAQASALRSAILDDPGRAYTDSVQRALVDAMIDFSAPMQLAADEYLTVAARDNERRDTLAPQNPYEEVVTVMLRIKGSDLAAYRAGTIDREEARRRVHVSQF